MRGTEGGWLFLFTQPPLLQVSSRKTGLAIANYGSKKYRRRRYEYYEFVLLSIRKDRNREMEGVTRKFPV